MTHSGTDAYKVGDRLPRLERALIKILAVLSLRNSRKLSLTRFEWIEDDKHIMTMRFSDMTVEVAITATVTAVDEKGETQ